MSSFTLKIHNRNLPAANNATSSYWPLTVTFASEPTLLEVKKAIHAKVSRLTVDRQRITTADKTALLDDRAKVSASNGDSLYVKDLGPQIGWRTVFLIEYFGPLFIHPLFYLASQKYYGSYKVSDTQQIALGLVLLHYLKREYETIFVHRFSSGTMPLFNVFKNSAHYWILSGVFLAASIYRPAYGAQALKGRAQSGPLYIIACATVWALAELGNFRCHLILRNLRSEGGRERKIPRGFAFEYVSCPNYFFETIAWVAFTFLTLSPASLLFSVVSVGQMVLWAIKKHKAYKKEFGKAYPRRKVMFPFLF